MGELRVIHPDLVMIYERTFERAYGYVMDGLQRDLLPSLHQARRELEVPTGGMDIRERAWHKGQQAAVNDLIEMAVMKTPASGEAT